jgi:hypothetical protein
VEHGRNIEEQKRAAVGCGLGDVIDPDHAAGTDAVLNHYGLLEPRLQPLGHGAADGVHAAAGRNRHHQRDRARALAHRRLGVERSCSRDRSQDRGDREP